MLKPIDGLPDDVLAVEAVGTVTHADYRDVPIPGAEAIMAKGKVRVLYVIGPDCTGFTAGAMWDDGLFGIRYWRSFSHIAVVMKAGPLRALMALFRPFIHGELRLFALDELAAAKEWIASADRPASA